MTVPTTTDHQTIMDEIGCSADEAELVLEARFAATRAYAPYSNFHVGCALRDPQGNVTYGCNIENGSLSLLTCSERCALFSHHAQGREPAITLAVTCLDGDPKDAGSNMPCGACRQVMQELLAPGAVIVVDHVGRFTIEELLPLPFYLATS